MSFELTSIERQSLRKQQKQTKDKREYIKLSIVLFLNAKASMTLIAEGLGIDINTVGKYKKQYDKAENLSQYLQTHYDRIKQH